MYPSLPRTGNPYEVPGAARLADVAASTFFTWLGDPSRDAAPYFITRLPDSLARDVGFGDLTPEGEGSNLLIGSAGTRSGLHFDYQDNLLAQIVGRKSILLAPPEASACFYPSAFNHSASRVDPDAPDPAAFPRYAQATRFETILEPGEVLFIPHGWWHAVTALTPSVSVNHYFGAYMGWRDHARVMRAAGARACARYARDAFLHGVLGRPYDRIAYTPTSTGDFLYQEARAAVGRGIRGWL